MQWPKMGNGLRPGILQQRLACFIFARNPLNSTRLAILCLVSSRAFSKTWIILGNAKKNDLACVLRLTAFLSHFGAKNQSFVAGLGMSEGKPHRVAE